MYAHLDRVDWPGIRDRIFGRIDAIEAAGRRYREGEECPNITVLAGHGEFVAPKTFRVSLRDGGSRTITADRFVLAAGSHAVLPDTPGLVDGTAPFHTSDTVMRIDDLPDSVVIVGGGYIASEFAHVFSSFGVRVTQVARGPALLRRQDDDISAAFTSAAARRYQVLTDTTVAAAKPRAGGGVSLQLTTPEGTTPLSADLLLVAIGRQPNGARLHPAATGVELDDAGRIMVDEYQRTSVDGIYALGDVSSPYQLKHVANHEARVVKHNLAHPDRPMAADHRFVPSAVFTDPQIAAVGRTERDLEQDGIRYIVGCQPYSSIAAGWAREDTTGFLKVLADPATGLLVGAHVIGPEAATVIQPLIQAMHFEQPATKVARGQYWIHPALSEVVENALLDLDLPAMKD